MPERYDVIVSGAGPSGSRAAFLCAQAGLSVLLLEKRLLSRDKCCAGGVLFRAVESLGEQGQGAPKQRVIDGMSIWWGDRRHDWTSGAELGWTVLRSELDRYLAGKAERRGAELVTSARVSGAVEHPHQVEVQVEGESLCASYLVLAEGTASGNASGLLGPFPRGALMNAAALKCQGDLGLGDRAGFIVSGKKEPLALAGARICAAFPLSQGVTLSTVSLSSGPKLKSALLETARLCGLEPQGRGCCHPIAVRPRVKLASRRCLCVGDCAGLASPFSGEGITPSLLSAELGAAAIASSVRSGRPSLSTYERSVRSQVEREQLLARSTGAALRLALGGGWARPLLAALDGDDAFLQAFVAVARRDDGSRRFLLKMLPRLPALLVSGADGNGRRTVITGQRHA
jgi:flavin-dependent dehydrogenase